LEPLFYLNKHLKDFERVIIYGAGAAGKALLMKMLQYNIKVECFADSNPDKAGRKILNIPIRHIKEREVLDMGETAAVVIGGLHIFDVEPELTELGFRHIFQDLAGPDYIHLERGV
jgi:NADH/NAD ratio-sensing transcriptional regulator Rex